MTQTRNILLDTDIGNDIDDMVALTLLHGLRHEGKVNIAAMLVSKDGPRATRFLDFYNSYLGFKVPVGRVEDGVRTKPKYLPLLELFMEIFPETAALTDRQFPEASVLTLDTLRSYAKRREQIDLVMIGFSTNIARVLATQEGRDLMGQVVPRLTIMAGNFDSGKPEFNIVNDVPSFQAVLEHFPGEITFCGWEVGASLRFPEDDIMRIYRRRQNMPLWYTYLSHDQGPHNRPNFDPLTVLYASGHYDTCFELSAPGRVKLGHRNRTEFEPDPKGRHRYLKLRQSRRTFVSREISRLVCDVV